MRKTITFLLLSLCICMVAQPPYERDLLEKELEKVDLKDVLIPREAWHPYPTYADSAEWDAIPGNIKQAFIDSASKFLDFDWGQLSATLYLDYHRTGSRAKYARVSYKRRAVLNYLVYAELIEREGRFTDKIIDGIWVICEESCWDVPAHLSNHQQKMFPDPEKPLVALMSAETGSMLAWIDYLMGGILDEVSPAIGERIYYEVQRRILTPAFEMDDSFWLGFKSGWVNNWNPWVNSNWLMANLLLEKDPERRIAAFKKSLLSIDNFINMYGEDGGCDEGPGYYGHAAGSLYDCLDIIHKATNGQIDVFDEPVINEMADFIRKAHIDGHYFVNFADASAVIKPYALLVYRFAKAVDNKKLKNFALYSFQNNSMAHELFPKHLKNFGRTLPNILLYEKVKGMSPDYQKCIEAWLPDIEVLYTRSTGKKELYLAAKGGHNDESHNHNDVGNFILYAEGKPVIIDAGVGTYTKKTFSSERYKIWTMQSGFHNLPVINGETQRYGRDFHASNIEFHPDKKETILKMDIAEAYPEEANVNQWIRTFSFYKSGKLILVDEYDLADNSGITWNFMAYATIEKTEEGVLRITSNDGKKAAISMVYDSDLLRFKLADISLEDPRLKKTWKHGLSKLQFELKNNGYKGSVRFVFY